MGKLTIAVANRFSVPAHVRLRIPFLRGLPIRSKIVCGMLMILVIASGQISGAQGPPSQETPAPTPAGEIIIETNPPGLNVLIDGDPQGASTVKTILAEGRHTYSIQCSNRDILTRNFSIAEGKISIYKVDCPVPLQPTAHPAIYRNEGRSNFAVDSTPARVRVWIDGRPRGASPLRALLNNGSHKLLVQCPGVNVSRNFVIEFGVYRSYVLTCIDSNPGAHMGDVTLETEPSRLNVLIDGKPHGPSPIQATLNQGRHYFTIECPDTGHFTKTFNIPPGQARNYIITCKVD